MPLVFDITNKFVTNHEGGVSDFFTDIGVLRHIGAFGDSKIPILPHLNKLLCMLILEFDAS